MDRRDVSKLLAVIVAYWPHFGHLGEPTLVAWHRALEHVPYELALAGVEYLAATRSFPPSVADLFEAMAEFTLPDDAKCTPAEAWKRVIHEVRSRGVYGRPNLPGLIGEAVKILGWRRICTSDEPEMTRAQFFRVYEQLQRRARVEISLSPRLRHALKNGAVNAEGALPDRVQQVVTALAGHYGRSLHDGSDG